MTNPFSYTSNEEIITVFERHDRSFPIGAHRFDLALGPNSPGYLSHASQHLHIRLDRYQTAYGPRFEVEWIMKQDLIMGFHLIELPTHLTGDRLEPTYQPWQELPSSFDIWIEGRRATYRGLRPCFGEDVVLSVETLDLDSDLQLICNRLYLMFHHLVDIYAVRAHYWTNEAGEKQFTGDLVVEGKFWHRSVTHDMLPGRYGQNGRWRPIRIRRSDRFDYPHSQFDFVRLRSWPNPALPQPQRLRKRKRPSPQPGRSLGFPRARKRTDSCQDNGLPERPRALLRE